MSLETFLPAFITPDIFVVLVAIFKSVVILTQPRWALWHIPVSRRHHQIVIQGRLDSALCRQVGILVSASNRHERLVDIICRRTHYPHLGC